MKKQDFPTDEMLDGMKLNELGDLLASQGVDIGPLKSKDDRRAAIKALRDAETDETAIDPAPVVVAEETPVPPAAAGVLHQPVTNQTPAEALPENDDGVEMSFPRDVRLCTDGGKVIHFKKGYSRVPTALKDHWYLKANGAKER